MARIVKEYDQRKKELLDAAQQLFYQNGYESTSVANIIDTVGIAKGTFYHYFKSKVDLLNQIIARQAEAIDQKIESVLEQAEMNAIEKYNLLYSIIGQYKAENKEVMIMMTKALYSDENIVLRDKMMRSRIKAVAPKLTRIISQGVSEGVFNTNYADYIPEMVMRIGIDLADEFARILSEEELNDKNAELYLERCLAYENAVARILGAQQGSLHIVDREIIKRFFEE